MMKTTATAQLLLLGSTLAPSPAAAAATNNQGLFPPGLPNDAPPYRQALLSLHKDLVEVPSISRDEGDAALLLERILTDRGYTVELQCLPDDDATTNNNNNNNTSTSQRCNVLAWPPGGPANTTSSTARVLVTTHIDVVPPYLPYRIDGSRVPAGPYDFLAPHITADTLLSGRGSVDAKASVAAQITAVDALVGAGAVPPSALQLLFVVGEEIGGDGMRFFSSSSSSSSSSITITTTPPTKPAIRAAIFGEPTENRLACGHKGATGGTLVARGRAGHSGYPWLGKSATEALVRGLAALLDADLGGSARFGNTTVNVGVLAGGVAANVIAPEANASLSVRVAVGDQATGARIVQERMRRALRETGEEALSLELRGDGYGPVECNCDVDGEWPVTFFFFLYVVLETWIGAHPMLRQGSRPRSSTTGRISPTSRATTSAICTGRVPSTWRTATMRACWWGIWRRRWRGIRS